MMNTSLVPSLQHLTCCKLISSLLNHLEVPKNFRHKNYGTIRSQVKDIIPHLIPCTSLQVTLEKFIDPLIREIEDWLNVFEQGWYGYDSVLRAVLESIPQCWLSDGTINREKSAGILVKNKDLRPINRFVFACTYCFFDDVVDLWNILYKIEKAYLRHKSTAIVKRWVEWLENSLVKDRKIFLAWTLGTSLWHSNAFILKQALQTISPAEKSQYLFDALTRGDTGDDIMHFCMSIMTKSEQEQVFREHPVKVFKWMLSWPLRAIFFDMADSLWPYLTEQSFCSILYRTLTTISHQERVDMELLIILKEFWEQSPCNFQNFAKDDRTLFRPLQFVLDFDVSLVFPKHEFSKSFLDVLPNTLPWPQLMMLHPLGRTARRRYTNLP